MVPAYNVEAYLAECLDSILDQSYEPLDVVIVDDGSTDGTATLARRYADAYPQIRVVPTPNRGLGAARNRGVAEASGEFIAFADSDDTVASGAYEVLVGALERSGSDFAVGSMRRFSAGEYDEPAWMARLHARDRLGLTVDDLPEILGDVFAWNKLFRRAFWERESLSFPEGVRYEDQVTLTHAYLTARTFDVVRPAVYNWRIRSDGSSITDGRHDVVDLADRVRTKRTALQTVRALADPTVQTVFRERVLPGDMWRYFANVPGCSDEYWDALHAAVREFWRDGALARSRLTPSNRLAGWLVGQGRRRDAEAVIRDAAMRTTTETVVANDEVLAALPLWDDPEAGVPLDLYRLRPDELGWDAVLVQTRVEHQALCVRGRARLSRAQVGDALVQIALTAGDGTTITSGRTPAEAFEARFDLRAVLSRWPPDVRDAPRVWRASVQWETHGLRHDGPLTRIAGPPDAGPSDDVPRPLASATIAGSPVDIGFDRFGLRVVVHPLDATPAVHTA